MGLDAFGVPDPAGVFTVVLRGLASNPIPNAIIRVERRLPLTRNRPDTMKRR